ncbi:hypothetical protein NX029_16065 [Cytobacillus firmus]|uniref:hypothetical protein n=1 Tax=Cytobacillus TaxID=2675230 RepID=UPI003CFA530E|nr:hypothetical protein [Cytobacillus firmus]
MLFHYHFWTPHVEETERFYTNNGFRIYQRIGKYQGDFQNFDPPLVWEDFREKDILFRIIEARKGCINVTFGYGKKSIFDHIGFLVNEKEQEFICQNAVNMNWNVDRGERRTFITTPYSFRIELQTNKDLVDSMTDNIKIGELRLEIMKKGLEGDLSILFGQPVNSIKSIIGETVTIREAVIKDFSSNPLVDPNGVRILN